MRGYAVGYDRGRRSQEAGQEVSPKPKSSTSLLLVLLVIVGAIWIVTNFITPRQASQSPGAPPVAEAWTSQKASSETP